MELFPAVMIGGPPHSGKSVLAYSLTRALRHKGIVHYLLRAYPDGEGDWANEADQTLVRRIRVKGDASPDWIDRICRDISNRHLPLIVDVGGRPTDWQEAIFNRCTHAILLAPNERARTEWRQMLVDRHGLPVLADLHSTLTGDDMVQATSPILKGRISHLERGHTASGPTFRAVADLLASLLAYDEAELRATHLFLAPAELVVELSRVGKALGLGSEWHHWLPSHLPRLLDYLPPNTPLALYDRGPNWLYAAIALHVYPAPIYQFDVRLGWVRPPHLVIDPEPAVSSPDGQARLTVRPHDRRTHIRLELALAADYLDYAEAEDLTVPPLPPGKGVVLSGKLPLWLWTALVRVYRRAPWVGIFQPQLGEQAVVVASQIAALSIGSQIDSGE